MKNSRKKKTESWLVRGYGNIILFLALLFVVFLTWLAMISTSVISPDYNEHTYFTRDSVFLNVVIIAITVFLVTIAGKNKKVRQTVGNLNQNDELTKRIMMIIFLTLSFILAWWILMLDCQPKADQQLVMETAKHMRFGDYVDFEKNGYVSMNHQQFGIVIMEYLLSFLFGTENYLALQLLNIPGLILCYVLMERIQKEIGFSNSVRLLTILLLVLFFPFSMYVIFVYGTIWGMALSLAAICLGIRFFHENNWKYLILSGLCITLAIFLKSNFEIFLIAMAVTAVMETIRQRKTKILVLPLLIIGLACGEHLLSEACIRKLAGDYYQEPMSTWTWIAMGTSENNIMADGWYSDAIGGDLYKVSYGDAEVDEILTKNIVKENIRLYQNNPDRFLRFLLKKTASQWNNPTFQGFWIVQRAPHVKTSLTQDPFVRRMYQYLNGMQIIVLSGSVLYILSARQKKPEELLFLLTFIGGFLFHLFWEAKCQYTLVYFILLIPYAVMGYAELSTKQNGKKMISINWIMIILMAVLFAMSLRIFPSFSKDVKVLQKDNWPVLKDVQDPWGFTS